MQQFTDRGVSLVGISVDDPADTVPWADRKGITFDLLADPEQRVIGKFGLVNEDRPELSLHAIYIVDRDGKVFYRKVARRRAYADEPLDAIDYHMGTYRKPVAKPQP